MDGLAATLAAIACAYYALDAVTEHENRGVLVLALSLGFALAGFLPFNLRPGRAAAVFMGDSGSQVLGFALAALALSSSWKVAGTTFATTVLPLLVLAIPILDTSLVTIVRLLERRPVTQGGRDHTSHRLVYYGLSEGKAVAAAGAARRDCSGPPGSPTTCSATARVTTIGVLFSFILLVQFASYLGDLEERSRRGEQQPRPSLRGLFVQPRRLVELLVDFALICGSFLVAYLLLVGGEGTNYQQVRLPGGAADPARRALSALRRCSGSTAASGASPARSTGSRSLRGRALGARSRSASLRLTRPLGDFPHAVFFVDALLCLPLVGASRLALRALPSDARPRRRARTGSWSSAPAGPVAASPVS